MASWNYEAGQIKIDNSMNFDDIVTNDKILDFLNIEKDYEKFFVVAPKGLGKTLLLKILSKKYRDNKHGIKYIPKNELCEKFGISMFSIKREEYNIFNDQNFWKDIWKYTIAITIAKNNDIELPEKLESFFRNNYDISSILDTILFDYKYFLFKNKNILSKELIPIIRSIQSPIIIFIDSFDQAIEELYKHQNFDFSDANEKKIAFELWANSQLGLMYAVNEFCQQQSHLKIFAAIREEAYDFDKSHLHLQITDFVCKINYTKNELEEIFVKNIYKTENTKLVSPHNKNPFIKFLGIDELPHAIVKNQKENIFDFIFRHTFGRPRELVLIGARLSEIPIRERNSNQIRNIVNKVSNEEIFRQFKQEIIPIFDENEFKNSFLSLLKENVFNKVEAENLPEYLLRYYYDLGLVGCLVKDHSLNTYYQHFELSYNKSINSDNAIPVSKYYFLHPALDKYFMSLGKKYNKSNIIGYNYSFQSPSEPKVSQSSIAHFGVGKLGIGLVIPALVQVSKKVILINRYNENWKKNSIHKYINFFDNDSNFNTFRFLSDDTSNEAQLEIIEEWQNNENYLLLVATNDNKLIQSLIKDINHISFSLKSQAGIEWLKSIINMSASSKTFYPFENNIADVTKFYKNINCHLSYIISDKICSSVNFSYSDGNVYCTCEPFGQIVLYSDNKENIFNSFQCKNTEIIHCETQKIFDYYYNRKFRLLNCVHAAIAIYCYSKLVQQRIPFADWQIQYLNLMQDLPEIKYKTELIIKGEILRLIFETDKNILNEVYSYHDNKEIFNELLRYSNSILERISKIPDKLERILPLNDFSKKYKERIKSLYDFYDNQVNYIAVKESNILTNEDKYREIRKNLNHLYQQMVELLAEILEIKKNS